MAADWRAEFQRDVVIDLVCYRKHGHNETDQPSFTQPLMYKRIQKHKSQIDIYIDQLLKDGSFTKEDIDEHRKWVWGMLEESFAKSKALRVGIGCRFS
ncbi:thiamine pyrophosphate-dependent enzyme [Bacillus velezensis]|uniref:thiamine pyrophosphate-dependent enzyme n=1 Tax=Bacillus velezensis TaxID=492670 RepID=UPI003C6C8875